MCFLRLSDFVSQMVLGPGLAGIQSIQALVADT
jgi:hypothetical protein